MAVKKYLSLEEAASALGVSTKDLISLRERGQIRGFADRGTWKFKSEDVEEYGRRQQADSNPDVPMLSDDDVVGEQPTVIRRSALDDDEDMPRGTSDSDVRLIVDPDLAEEYPGGKSGVAKASLSDSDSDVRLLDAGAKRRKGSDSDVKIVGNPADSDSDVRLAGKGSLKDTGSDSDVMLVGSKGAGKSPEESDSDVKLLPNKKGNVDTEADMNVLALPAGGANDSVFSDESDLVLDDESGLTLKAASGISLEKLMDSGISLESGDSGIALMGAASDSELGGSGILLSGDSGATLADADDDDATKTRAMTRGKKPKKPAEPDSNLTLADAPDSGIALSSKDDMGLVLDDDSGIGLASAADSGIALDRLVDSGLSLESSDVNRTVPMMGSLSDDLDGTNVEVPMLDEEGSNYELKMPGAESGDDVADTSVILFDDDDAGHEGATRLGKSFDDEPEAESFDLQDAGDEVEEESDLEVAEDVIGEDDELDEMDVFDAADEDFDESFSTGESHAEFVAPVRGAAYEAPPAEWGAGTFVGLLFSTLFLSVCGMVMFDLVRSMWAWNEPSAVSKALIDQIGNLF